MVISDKQAGIYYIIGAICGFVCGFLIMLYLASNIIDRIRQEAIDANVAKWTIDEKTGEKSFKFSDLSEERDTNESETN